MSVSRVHTIEATLMGHVSCNNAHGDSLLHWAIREHGASLAGPLILSGVPANLPNDEGQTPLHLAVAANDLETCKLLVASTASSSLLHSKDKRGCSSVQLAILRLFYGLSPDDSILDWLIQQGARSSQYEDQWFWAFCSAICSGNSVFDAFLRHGKSLLDKHPTTGETAVHVVLHFTAPWSNALAPVKLLLEAGVDVNAVDNDGITALHLAVQRDGANDVVRYLVKHGAKVDAIAAGSGNGDTPLVSSIIVAQVENARALIEAGANVFHKYREGLPLLHLAALLGKREILELLLTVGVQVNTLDKAGETAAYWACNDGHLDCLNFLMSQGLDPKAGETDLMEKAIKRGHLPIVESLWDHGTPITVQHLTHPFFLEDVHQSRWDMLYFLMRHLKPFPDVKSDNDAHAHNSGIHLLPRYPLAGSFVLAAAHLEVGHKFDDISDAACAMLLFICAQHGFLSGAQAILDVAPPRSEVRNYHYLPHGWGALEVAACENNIALVQLLLEHDWNPNRKDLHGRTSLHLAALCGAAAVVKTLLNEHNIHRRDKNKDTPLHLAARSGSVSVLELLVDAGGDVHTQNKVGETPLGIACEWGHAVAVRWLLDRMGDSSHRTLGPLHNAARGNHVDCMEHLIVAEFDVNARHAGGNTPLHVAAAGGSWKAVSRLLEAEADPNCLNDQGKTPSALAFSHTDVPPDVTIELLKRFAGGWDLPLSRNILFNVCVGGNKSAMSAVLDHLSQDRPKYAKKTVRRLLPELLGKLCSSGPAANNTTAFSLLLPYLHSSSKEALSTTMLSATIAAADDAELAQSLVDINPKNADLRMPRSCTMLHLACRYGRIKIARVLLANGAPAGAESEDGVTALGMAKKHLEGEMLERFVDLFRGYEATLKVLRENKELQDLILAAQSGICRDSNSNDGCDDGMPLPVAEGASAGADEE
ncbi:hypothetical protein RB595_010479 [Gaeumannomyces hyphopodioides]